MKCQAYIDPETKIALEGEELIKAYGNSDAPRCGYELEPGDMFCPSCGACVEISLGGRAKTCNKKLNVKRTTRAAFWGSVMMFFLTNVLCLVLAGENYKVMDESLRRGIFLKILGYVNIFAYGYFIKTSVRRLHDIDRSGWWIVPSVCFMIVATISTVISAVTESNNVAFSILYWVAIIGNLGMVAWLGFAKGTKGPNKYGPDPLADDTVLCNLEAEAAEKGEASVGISEPRLDNPKHDGDDQSRPSSTAFVEQSSKPRAKSLAIWIVVFLVCGIMSSVIRYNSRQSMKRANDTLFRNSNFVDSDLQRIMDRVNNELEFNKGVRYYNGDGVEQDKKEAVKWFRKAAEQGNASAQLNLGYCYENGEGVEQNKAEAVKWYRKAADQGEAKAQYNLGNCYDNGEGVEQDKAEAVEWYRKAAEQGDADAQYNLGLCLLYGKGTAKNPKEAADWFEKAAEQDNLDACYEMGRAYERGNGRTKDMDKAAKWYQTGAASGNPACCSQLGYRYLNGDCNVIKKDVNKALELFLQAVKANPKGQWAYHGAGLAFLGRGQSPSDFQKAAEMFRKAADIGLVQSQHYLGKCYEKGQGVSKDPKEAVKWYRKAAEQGYVVSEYNLGVCYRDGWGVNKDLVKSADWFEKAAKHGNPQACHEIGQICRFGKGRNTDMDKAAEWFKKGAEVGHSGSCCQLGFRYFWGDSSIVKRDNGKALALFEKAIEGGNPLGYYGAGRVYLSGLSGKPDNKKAFEMFKKGAELKDLESTHYMGICYDRGLGVKVDKAEAVKCYEKSCGAHLRGPSLEKLCSIGDDYLLGRSVDKDEVKAFRVYEIAANKGSSRAMNRLGKCYEKGQGVAKDLKEAVKWYRKAAEQGHIDAKKALKRLKINSE